VATIRITTKFALPNAGQGQLPEHEMAGQRLVRVYLQVDYDYAENRIGALAAHVTTSDHQLLTPFETDPETGRVRPAPRCIERRATGSRCRDSQGSLMRARWKAGTSFISRRSPGPA